MGSSTANLSAAIAAAMPKPDGGLEDRRNVRESARTETKKKPAWRVFFHPDVDRETERQPVIQRRVALLLRYLAAHGRAPVLKGCAETENKGWLRAPAGGNTGNQFYLWLQIKADRTIYVRALRHHDDHTLLTLGEADDYLELTPDAIADTGWFEAPWSAAQRQIIEERGKCVALIGLPGSGKTTATWEKIIQSDAKNSLYITYSKSLAAHAGEYFEAFLKKDQRIQIVTAHDLISIISGIEIGEHSIRAARSMLEQLSKFLPPQIRPNWERLSSSVYAEARAHLYGMAPMSKRSRWEPRLPGRMPTAEYLEKARKRAGGDEDIPKWTLSVFDTIQKNEWLQRVFPELAAAAQARRRLRQGVMPKQLLDINQIVLDEAQDLTMAEISVVVDLVKAIGKQAHRPSLIIAGDESQTIRPTGFEWSSVNDLVFSEGLGKIKEITVSGNQRCPKNIGAVIDKATQMYKALGRSSRPSHAGEVEVEPATNGRLRLVVDRLGPSPDEAIERLSKLEGVALVSPCMIRPKHIGAQAWHLVKGPEEIKGLEFQSVIIIDPLQDVADETERDRGKADDALRTDIDRLRVCLSRATETLVALCLSPNTLVLSAIRRLFEGAVEVSFGQLCEELSAGERTPEKEVNERINQSKSIIHVSQYAHRALQSAGDAVARLGDKNLPGGVASDGVRVMAAEQLMYAALTMAMNGLRPRQEWEDDEWVSRPPEWFEAWRAAVPGLIRIAAAELDVSTDGARTLAETMSQAIAGPSRSRVCRLYRAIYDAWPSGAEILKKAIAICRHSPANDIEGCIMMDPDGADMLLAEGAEGFLVWVNELCPDSYIDEYAPLHGPDALLIRRRFSDAEQLIKRYLDSEPAHLGRLRENQENWAEAARLFEAAGDRRKAVAMWRRTGNLEKAVAIGIDCESKEQRGLEWLLDLEKHLKGGCRPRELYQAEKERLEAAQKSIQTLLKNIRVLDR